MGKLTTTVFNESCCDGGACANDQSCQPCGCDPGANWVCERHREENRLRAALQKIYERCGKVCANFELCEHVSCSSSFEAWHIADTALRGEEE